MKIISIINLKGGVAKTITSVNLSHILATVYHKRVLLIDNDKQGNASKVFGLHSYEKNSVSEILTNKNIYINEIIVRSQYENLDVIPANMTLLKANLEVMLDSTRPQQLRFKKALANVAEKYDYCIIDNAPDINIGVINALVASNEIIIPIKIDQFAFDGLSELIEQINNVREDFNPSLLLRGCLVTYYQNNEVNNQGKEWLCNQSGCCVFDTHIRRTEKVDESTFAKMPIISYSKRCGASQDYLMFVKEYLGE